MELLWVVVVKQNEEAKCAFDNGEGVFGCEIRHSSVGEDKDGDCLATVDFIG